MLNDLTNSTENDELISVVQSFRNFENIEKKEKDFVEVKNIEKEKFYTLCNF